MKFWKKIARFRPSPALIVLDLTAGSLSDWKRREAEEILRRGRRRTLLLVLWSFGVGVMGPKALGYAVFIVYSLVRTHGLALPLRTYEFLIILHIAVTGVLLFDVTQLAREQTELLRDALDFRTEA